MISNIRYWFLLFLIFLVYLAGLFVTLLETDSARSAVMAMHMVQQNDFINLFSVNGVFSQKPHLHFWFAAFSFKIFGLSDWAYRIPGFLMTLLAAYSCFGLGKSLYNAQIGKLAALVFMTAQIIVISNTDVQIDTLLTGFSIFAIWQFVNYGKHDSLTAIILGAVGSALAFSVAGLSGLLFVVLPLCCYLIYARKWSRLFSWKTLLAVLIFCIAITPACYAYFLQFESHAALSGAVSKNQENGLAFFWQGLNGPLGGNRFGFDFFDIYFIKDCLWTFLPWTLIGLLAYIGKFKWLLRSNLGSNPKFEFLTLGGVSLLFVVAAFVENRTIHFLNPMIPLIAIMVASYLYEIYRFRKTKLIKTLLGIQYLIFALIFILSVLLCYFVFKIDNPLNYIWKILLVLLAIVYSLKREDFFYRLITISVLCALMINVVLNAHAFPGLVNFQAGSSMAKVIVDNEIPTDNIYKLSGSGSWTLDFYIKKPLDRISLSEILNRKNIWVYANELQLKELRNLGYDWDRQYHVDQLNTGKLDLAFMDPATRKGVLGKMYLIHIY